MSKQTILLDEALQGIFDRVDSLERAVVALDRRATIDQALIQYLIITVKKADPDLHEHLMGALESHVAQLNSEAEQRFRSLAEYERFGESGQSA
jgi:hypothetical protein